MISEFATVCKYALPWLKYMHGVPITTIYTQNVSITPHINSAPVKQGPTPLPTR